MLRLTTSIAASALAISAQSVVATSEQPAVLEQRINDTDGDGRSELVLIRPENAQHAAAAMRLDLSANAITPRDAFELNDAAHCLLAIEDLLPTPGDELVIWDSRGARCIPWTLAGQEQGKPVRLVRGRRNGRFHVRIDQPMLSPFVSDLNQDGKLDLLLPGMKGVTPYLHDGDDDGVPKYRRIDPVYVPVNPSVGTGSGGIDPELTGGISIPMIKTLDVNGDERPDLLTVQDNVHSYHLQNDDGTFAKPITVDITQFEDSTPKAVVDLGNTFVLGDRQWLQSGDINGDKIPDYVIAHRRKIWTFLASEAGPQFRKPRTQAVADDVTFMLVLDIDEDDRADLLTFRVTLPSLGALLLALVQSIDIDVKAVGYQSENNGFARKPKWRRTVTLRVPPLLSLLNQQDQLVERFTNEINKTRVSSRSAFGGGDALDLAIVNADRTALELLHDVGEAPNLTSVEGRRMLRNLLFEDENTIFDLDRVFELISGVIDKLAAKSDGERQTAATVPLRDPTQWHLTALLPCEANGQPGNELIAVYHLVTDDNHRAYDLIDWQN